MEKYSTARRKKLISLKIITGKTCPTSRTNPFFLFFTPLHRQIWILSHASSATIMSAPRFRSIASLAGATTSVAFVYTVRAVTSSSTLPPPRAHLLSDASHAPRPSTSQRCRARGRASTTATLCSCPSISVVTIRARISADRFREGTSANWIAIVRGRRAPVV